MTNGKQYTRVSIQIDKVSEDDKFKKLAQETLDNGCRLSYTCYLNGIIVAAFLFYSQAEKYCEDFNRFCTAKEEKMKLVVDK